MTQKMNKKVTLKEGEIALEGNYTNFRRIACIDIAYSPLNYRKFINKEDLESFGQELLLHGIISPVTVRLLPSGKFELVAGERRLRAAILMDIKTVPAVVKQLSDEEVIEIQLAENIQRENPHPMHEAMAIGQLQVSRKTIEEIAARLGKSRQFVYARLKLLSLIEPFQEMFVADKITTQQAVDIASLATAAQEEFYREDCAQWKKDKAFALHDLGYSLRQYRYDLCHAPFNIKDKKLLESAGACTQCPSNTATLKSLFPELAKQAVCNNITCYQTKCRVQLVNQFQTLCTAEQPTALLLYGEPSASLEYIFSLLLGAAALPRHDRNTVTVLERPVPPDADDFTGLDENEEEGLNQAGFDQAMEEYAQELEQYECLMQQGNYQKAIQIIGNQFQSVIFSLEKPTHNASQGYNQPGVTAKAVQAAVKAGTATPQLLLAEMERINQKEKRAQEIDKDKIQLQVHEQFTAQMEEGYAQLPLTEADQVAARLLIYQSLDYTGRQAVDCMLFTKRVGEDEPAANKCELLAGLTEVQFSHLIRAALLNKSDSKYPAQETGQCLVKVAEAAGLNVAAIEAEQQQKAAARQQRQQTRIQDLQNQIEKLSAE